MEITQQMYPRRSYRLLALGRLYSEKLPDYMFIKTTFAEWQNVKHASLSMPHGSEALLPFDPEQNKAGVGS